MRVTVYRSGAAKPNEAFIAVGVFDENVSIRVVGGSEDGVLERLEQVAQHLPPSLQFDDWSSEWLYPSPAEERAHMIWDRAVVAKLPASYLYTFLMHLQHGGKRADFPNPFIVPHPDIMLEEAWKRGWIVTLRTGKMAIKPPRSVKKLKALPETIPA
jgi:hypothetical protein